MTNANGKNNIYQTIIIGGGLSGLSVAHFLKEQEKTHRFLLLEKGERLGGAICTFRKDGILAEPGAHGFLDNCPEMQKLLHQLELDKECVKASLQEFVRYVYHQGRLKKIEQSPMKILTAPLISPLEKIGVLRDLFKKPLPGEPSVADWCEYHFGVALLPYLDAVYTGTYAGDIERLAIDSVMPGVRALEKEHGSIIRGLFAKMKAVKKSGKRHPQLPAMTSFSGGMQKLVERLAERLSQNEVQKNCTVTAITRKEAEWRIDSTAGSFYARNIVLALPINHSLALLRNCPQISSVPSIEIVEAKIANIAITLPKNTKIPAGFGFLVPEQEKKFILGALFSSNMFAGRASEEAQLIEVLVGGRRHGQRLQCGEKELVQRASADLLEILQLNCEILSAQLLPMNTGIPQLEEGSPALLQWKENAMSHTKNLFLCGFGWNGIGVNDMIKASWKTAEQLSAGREKMQEPALKPIYF